MPAGLSSARAPVKYFIRTNSPDRAAGPFDLERACARLREALDAARGRGHTVHEGQRGIWLIDTGDEDTRLCWITDEDDEVVRLEARHERAMLLQ